MNAVIPADLVHSKALPDLVSKLLAARQDSLVLYSRLVALRPFTPTHPLLHILKQFCQSLVDYLALGPFEVFETLEEQPAGSPYSQARDLARNLYSHIARTTQAALKFHDCYEGKSEPELTNLGQDLSCLGEDLATRIELEDKILTAIRKGSPALAV